MINFITIKALLLSKLYSLRHALVMLVNYHRYLGLITSGVTLLSLHTHLHHHPQYSEHSVESLVINKNFLGTYICFWFTNFWTKNLFEVQICFGLRKKSFNPPAPKHLVQGDQSPNTQSPSPGGSIPQNFAKKVEI